MVASYVITKGLSYVIRKAYVVHSFIRPQRSMLCMCYFILYLVCDMFQFCLCEYFSHNVYRKQLQLWFVSCFKCSFWGWQVGWGGCSLLFTTGSALSLWKKLWYYAWKCESQIFFCAICPFISLGLTNFGPLINREITNFWAVYFQYTLSNKQLWHTVFFVFYA